MFINTPSLLIRSVRKLIKFNYFFDKKIIDGILNGIGITSFLAQFFFKCQFFGILCFYLFVNFKILR